MAKYRYHCYVLLDYMCASIIILNLLSYLMFGKFYFNCLIYFVKTRGRAKGIFIYVLSYYIYYNIACCFWLNRRINVIDFSYYIIIIFIYIIVCITFCLWWTKVYCNYFINNLLLYIYFRFVQGFVRFVRPWLK